MKLNSLTNLLFLILATSINILEIFCSKENAPNLSPEVSLPLGKIRGTEITTRKKRIVYGFRGIPFAQPPVGNLRFRAPVAAFSWNGTLDATKYSNVCTQEEKWEIIGDEDCLYLNVYTPQIRANVSNLLPVMFWIHGGTFRSGSGNNARPDYMLDKDVVLVAPNYRLGPLGFLSTGDEVSPGNYGLKDQVLALRWVKSNVQYFGGDPNRVTIIGLSAGSASADLLALSESTNGLYHRSIKLSGSSLSPRGYVPRNVIAGYSFRLGEHLGCSNATSSTLVDCLRNLNASQITDTTSLFLKWERYPDSVWRPTDEPDNEDAFITKSPEYLYANGKVKDLPTISGVTRDESLLVTASLYRDAQLFDEFLVKIDDLLPYVLLCQDREDASNFTAVLKSYYLNDLTAERNVLLANLTELVSDVYYTYPVHRANKKQFATGNSAKYFYSFEYLRTYKYLDTFNSVIPHGIQHSDDEPFLFPLNDPLKCNSGWVNCKFSENDFKMVDIVIDLWTSFATNGTPSTSLNNGVTWSPYSDEDNYLRIGNGPDLSIEMKNSFLKERMDFWDKLTPA